MGSRIECPLDHPTFIGRYPNDWRYTARRDSVYTVMHLIVWVCSSVQLSSRSDFMYSPAILPCSQSMQIQSNPDRAMVLDKCAPGSICHAPKERPLPFHSALRKILELFIIDAMAVQQGRWSGRTTKILIEMPSAYFAERKTSFLLHRYLICSGCCLRSGCMDSLTISTIHLLEKHPLATRGILLLLRHPTPIAPAAGMTPDTPAKALGQRSPELLHYCSQRLSLSRRLDYALDLETPRTTSSAQRRSIYRQCRR
jgi:hypothetical protein